MKVGWLIDGDMFAGYRDELVEAIRAQGHEAKLIHAPNPPYRWDDDGCSYRNTFPPDMCVVAHGDIELATRIVRDRRWIPGAFCTVENFYWSNYVCHFGEFLLNREYIMLPFGELSRQREFLFATMGEEDRIFVRPDSPLKLFTGQLVSQVTFNADLEFMAFYEFPLRSLVVVSTPKQIASEWRFIVADGKVIAGCQYSLNNTNDCRPDYDPLAFELATKIARHGYQPDPVWVLDVCKTASGSYHLLEIGGFSFSDLYACNKADVVAAVSAVAVAKYDQSASQH